MASEWFLHILHYWDGLTFIWNLLKLKKQLLNYCLWSTLSPLELDCLELSILKNREMILQRFWRIHSLQMQLCLHSASPWSGTIEYKLHLCSYFWLSQKLQDRQQLESNYLNKSSSSSNKAQVIVWNGFYLKFC